MTDETLFQPKVKVKKETSNLTIRLDADLKAKFDKLCAKHGVSMSEVMIRFIESQVQDGKRVSKS